MKTFLPEKLKSLEHLQRQVFGFLLSPYEFNEAILFLKQRANMKDLEEIVFFKNAFASHSFCPKWLSWYHKEKYVSSLKEGQ